MRVHSIPHAMKPILTALAATCLAVSVGHAADPTPADAERQLRGASAMALLSKGEAVRRTLQFCTEKVPSLALRSERVEAGWRERNDRYLALLPLLEKESQKDAAEHGRAQEWKSFVENKRPVMLDHVREMFVAQIADTPEASREALCNTFANDFAAGRFDFAADHQIIDYLERRLKEQSAR
jgi:hypothetical protein